jgi:O-methyltransferase
MIDKYEQIYELFKGYTMVPREEYLLNLLLVDKAIKVAGSVVECGTWKGGMIGGIAKLLGNARAYNLFDSFQGLPPAKEDIDGLAAVQWQADKESPDYYNNCTAEKSDAIAAMGLAGVQNYRVVKGWFEDTLAAHNWQSPIAILRLDGDWYDSTLTCMEQLFPLVAIGGIVIVDDYFVWDGCSRAIHDYLSRESSITRIHQFQNRVCYLIKR